MKNNLVLTALLFGLILGIATTVGVYEGGFKTLIADEPIQYCEAEQVIRDAAARNGCDGDDMLLLFAIYKAEGDRFGIKHPRCDAMVKAEPNLKLDIEAGWAAATIMNQHRRLQSDIVNDDFIESLCDRYCPKSADPIGNENLKSNVRYFYRIMRVTLEVKANG